MRCVCLTFATMRKKLSKHIYLESGVGILSKDASFRSYSIICLPRSITQSLRRPDTTVQAKYTVIRWKSSEKHLLLALYKF